MCSMMSLKVRRLPHGLTAVPLVVGAGLAFLISRSAARADTIVRGGLGPVGVAVDRSGDVFISNTNDNRVLLYKPSGSLGYTQSVVDDTGLAHPHGVAVNASGDVFIDHGSPGERAVYHPGYYGAFVLDPDGHNVEVVNHNG
jgi:hypothetical protein